MDLMQHGAAPSWFPPASQNQPVTGPKRKKTLASSKTFRERQQLQLQWLRPTARKQLGQKRVEGLTSEKETDCRGLGHGLTNCLCAQQQGSCKLADNQAMPTSRRDNDFLSVQLPTSYCTLPTNFPSSRRRSQATFTSG